MPIVAMPDGAQVQFPDDMPEDQIRSLILQKFPDIAQPPKDRSIGAGIADIWNKPDGNASLIGMAKTLYQGARGPGDALAGKFSHQPQTPGQWTEEDQFLADLKAKQGNEAAGGMAGLAIPGNIAGSAVRTRPAPLPEVKAQAAADYAKYRASGATFEPELTTALADDVGANLRAQGRYPHLEGQNQVFNTVDLLKRGEALPADEFRSIREALNSLKTHEDPKVRSAAGAASEQMLKFLERNEPEAAAALKRADQGYGVVKRAQEISNREDVADLRTGRAGYGGNAVNNMRQVLSPIVEKAIKGNKQGYNEAEIAAMREIVEGTTATNVLRGVGQMSPSKGIFATGLAGATLGGTAVLGAAANRLADILTRKQFERLNELVRKRSPAYEEAVRRSADKFGTAADQFVIEPTQKNFIKTITAARALSNGLTRDGITVSSGDLLRTIQGGKNAAADDEQPEP